jgi:cell division initiation protein
MKITPLDILRKKFPMKFMGFDKGSVDSFLQLVREQLEELLRENAFLREEGSKIERELADYKKIESDLRNTLMNTHHMLEEYKKEAYQEIEIFKRETESRADRALKDAQKKIIKIHGDMTDLRRLKKHFQAELRQMIESHLKMLDVHDATQQTMNLITDDDINKKRKMLIV